MQDLNHLQITYRLRHARSLRIACKRNAPNSLLEIFIKLRCDRLSRLPLRVRHRRCGILLLHSRILLLPLRIF